MAELSLADIFQPLSQKRRQAIDEMQARFAYYTSATTALNILRGRELWMRSAACMNDYREIDYGIQLLNHAIYGNEQRRQRIQQLTKRLNWGESVWEHLLGNLNRSENALVTRTYLACVSEHSPDEEQRGRLSMWRAYGRKTGVAFVLKAKAILHSRHPLPIRMSPVTYLDQTGFDQAVDRILNNVDRNVIFLQQLGSTKALNYFMDTVLFSLFSIKHPGFIEEREWRIIYQESAGQLPYDSVSVDGIPQVVYKLPVCGAADRNPGLQLVDALDHIIIGPSQYADVIFLAFVKVLEEMGIPNAAQKVYKSNIPLR